MSVIKQSISLEEQPTKVYYKESPSTRYLGTIDYEVDASEYEEYSFIFLHLWRIYFSIEKLLN